MHLNPDFTRIEGRQSDEPADILFTRKSEPDARAAVLIFGPYSNWKEYDSRFGSFMGMVAGLASYCERVLAIVPDHSRRYWRWLYERKIEGVDIDFYAVHYHGDDFDPRKISRPMHSKSASRAD